MKPSRVILALAGLFAIARAADHASHEATATLTSPNIEDPPWPTICISCNNSLADCMVDCQGNECDAKCRCDIASNLPLVSKSEALQLCLGGPPVATEELEGADDASITPREMPHMVAPKPDPCHPCQVRFYECKKTCKGEGCENWCRCDAGRSEAVCTKTCHYPKCSDHSSNEIRRRIPPPPPNPCLVAMAMDATTGAAVMLVESIKIASSPADTPTAPEILTLASRSAPCPPPCRAYVFHVNSSSINARKAANAMDAMTVAAAMSVEPDLTHCVNKCKCMKTCNYPECPLSGLNERGVVSVDTPDSMEEPAVRTENYYCLKCAMSYDKCLKGCKGNGCENWCKCDVGRENRYVSSPEDYYCPRQPFLEHNLVNAAPSTLVPIARSLQEHTKVLASADSLNGTPTCSDCFSSHYGCVHACGSDGCCINKCNCQCLYNPYCVRCSTCGLCNVHKDCPTTKPTLTSTPSTTYRVPISADSTANYIRNHRDEVVAEVLPKNLPGMGPAKSTTSASPTPCGECQKTYDLCTDDCDHTIECIALCRKDLCKNEYTYLDDIKSRICADKDSLMTTGMVDRIWGDIKNYV
ncbi:hypothetical protein BS50DRAFT_591493 [Corynespora cassiicola Philippines]|uniref:Uncharacterized protein n=1 Tax=Corynespora cassiicola Philippines TaxID=1448308 RepID=A0A2T2NE66_CORCC|nr:hypothetical protein BS50DRAFT_591493 [Corynespora cassiicola Philippines]